MSTTRSAHLVPIRQVRERTAIAAIACAPQAQKKIQKTNAESIRFAQMVTIVVKPPERLTLRTIPVLAAVLKCRTGDVLGVDPATT